MVQTKPDADLQRQQLILQYAVEARKFEIEHFWKRSVYFWGLVAAALVAFGALDETRDGLSRTVIVCFGFLTSVAWSLQSRGSKYWQEALEQKVNQAQVAVLNIDLFEKKEPFLPLLASRKRTDFWLRSRGYSVSKLAIAMSDMSVLLWLALAIYHAKLNSIAPWDEQKAAFFTGSVALAVSLSIFGRSSKQPPTA